MLLVLCGVGWFAEITELVIMSFVAPQIQVRSARRCDRPSESSLVARLTHPFPTHLHHLPHRADGLRPLTD